MLDICLIIGSALGKSSCDQDSAGIEEKSLLPLGGPSSLTIPSRIRNHSHNTWLGQQLGSALITVEDRWGYTDLGT